MRVLLLLLALALPAWSQDKAPAAPKKKPAAKQPSAHKKPSAEQIRKFNQLEKKQATAPKKK